MVLSTPVDVVDVVVEALELAADETGVEVILMRRSLRFGGTVASSWS
jgi:hypothetical protein